MSNQCILYNLYTLIIFKCIKMNYIKVIKKPIRWPVIYVLPVVQRDVGQILSPGSVHGIRESGMIGVQLGSVRQDLICVLVQVSDPQREPRYVFWKKCKDLMNKRVSVAIAPTAYRHVLCCRQRCSWTPPSNMPSNSSIFRPPLWCYRWEHIRWKTRIGSVYGPMTEIRCAVGSRRVPTHTSI